MDVREGGSSEEEETSGGIYSETDSEEDPCYEPLEEARSRLSRISLNTSRHREVESEIQDEHDLQACETGTALFEKVEKLIKDGKVDKLKVEECKVYLRRYSLRLSGNKSDLLARIKEHLEILGGGGLTKYPVASFTLNCKGDACMGDVVMFQQEGIVSRTVVGRIVKESYGTAKQQHTFTVSLSLSLSLSPIIQCCHLNGQIEVLWSKGKKPLPVLYPLLIKGRNLYKLKTMRQAWPDEEERKKVLDEKHRRGHAARCSRETRIREKELRIMMGAQRRLPTSQESMNKVNDNLREMRENLQQVQAATGFPQIPIIPEKRENFPPVHETTSMPRREIEVRSHGNRHSMHHNLGASYGAHKQVGPQPRHGRPLNTLNAPPPRPPPSSSSVHEITRIPHHQIQVRSHANHHPMHHTSGASYGAHKKIGPELCHRRPLNMVNAPPPPPPSSSVSSSIYDHQPLVDTHTANAPRIMNPTVAGRDSMQTSICVFHLQKRCRFGDSCKYIHMDRDVGSLIARYR